MILLTVLPVCWIFQEFIAYAFFTICEEDKMEIWQGGPVRGQYNKFFCWEIYMKMEFLFPDGSNANLFLTPNKANVTSRANQQ